MEKSKPSSSFFRDINSRELNGFRVRKRPYVDAELPEYSQTGAIAIEHDDESPPPMALSFCKSNKHPNILAVADEAGYISLLNSRLQFSSSTTFQENADKAKVAEWLAHDNAIFDLCWIQERFSILTASGDQCIKLWDAQEMKCVRALLGHTGSVKTIHSHPTNQDLVISGSRDGSFALWDLRCSQNSTQKICRSSTATVRDAHAPPNVRQVRRAKAAATSITSVLFLRDEVSVATAGASDSVVKLWDTRNLKRPYTQACSDPTNLTQRGKRSHGISSLSQDLNGVYISASCTDSRIYLYNILQLEKGPVKTFSGGRIGSFFVKSAISPDAAHILGGSGDGNAYVWQVNKPEADPMILKSHNGEVTAVDWCPYEMGKIATSSDDFTVRMWKIQGSCYSNTRSPSSIRRRVVGPTTRASSSLMRKKLFEDFEVPKSEESESKSSSSICKSNDNIIMESSSLMSSPPRRLTVMNNMIISTTPKSETEKKKRVLLSSMNGKENWDKTPESAAAATTVVSSNNNNSPSSVLSPPPSLRRKTIRDYFISLS